MRPSDVFYSPLWPRNAPLLLQSKGEQRIARGYRDELPPLDRIGHGTGGDGSTERDAPLEIAVPGVEREEISFTSAGNWRLFRPAKAGDSSCG